MRARFDNVVNVNAMDDHIRNILNADLRAADEVDVCTAAIDSLVAGHEKLPFELDGHAVSEDDPEGLGSSHSVA